MAQKTNAMRLLDAMGVEYEVVEYEVDEEHLDALSASRKANLDPELVYKTIVMKGSSGGLHVFVTPALFTISMKKAREVAQERDLELLKLDLLLKYTGYIRGGCSPIGMIHRYPVYIEELAQLEDAIYVSAGKRGFQLKLRPDDLIRATDGIYASFT